MSVSSPLKIRSVSAYVVLPLLGGLLLLAAAAVWWYWPQLLLQSVIWQKALHQEMIVLLQRVAQQPHQAGLLLSGFSLLYGVLHALGPGHGKVVIATFLATHPTRLKTSLRLTLVAAMVQGLVAVALVTLLLVILQRSSRELHLGSFWVEKGSYLLVAGLGVWLSWRALCQLKKLWARPTPWRIRPLTAGHQHHVHCGCGHQHLPDETQLARATSWKTKALLVLSMGLRPCSGAVMMLLFSRVIGVYGWGVISALVMALGTALTVSAMALLVHSSQALARRLNRHTTPSRGQRVALHVLALAGGGLLILTGMLLWISATPAAVGGIRGML